MPDPISTHLAEHYRTYGIVLFSGGIVTMVKVHSSNIRSLWLKVDSLVEDKTDKEQCDKHQIAVQDGFKELKGIMEASRKEMRTDMEELRTDRRNLEQHLFDHMRQNGVNNK